MLHDTLDSAPEAQGPGGTAGVSGHLGGLAHGQNEVSRLLSVIADQIAEADRRNCEALDEMKQRLQQLGADARIARPQVPQEFAPSFSRIEDALSQLAERISAARTERAAASAPDFHRDGLASEFQPASLAVMTASIATQIAAAAPIQQQPPMALRSAAPAAAAPGYNWASDFSRSRSDQLAPDPFDIIDNGGSLKSNENWSLSEAEALTRIYEDVPFDAEPILSAPLSIVQPVNNVVPMMPTAEPALEAAAVSVRAPQVTAEAHTPSAFPALDQKWMEDRFADLAQRLQASFDETPVHDMLATLDERLSQLEVHLGLSLQDVAKRSDVAGLKIVEAHIEEMSRHLEQTQGQLGRLDGIEAQLNEVVEHLAAQFESRQTAPAALPAVDFHRIAEEAAASVATRFAGTMSAHASGQSGASSADEIASVRGLLESYIGERRDGDEHNALMLDTMQQALIRVLDRIDAMESKQARPSPAAAAASYPYAAEAAYGHAAMQPADEAGHEQDMDYRGKMQRATDVPHTYDEAPEAAAPAHHNYEDYDEPVPAVAASGHGASAVEMPEAARSADAEAPAEELTGIKKLRQDMIADAQRAKLRAAAEQAEAAANADAKGSRGRKSANLSGGAGRPKVSPKILVAAAVLLAMIGGMWVFSPSSAPEPVAEQGPAAVQPATTAPAPAPGAVKANPGAASAAPAGKPQAAVPAAGSAPVSANGFVIEPDATGDIVPAPNKISDDYLDTPPPGIRLRQSAEAVSPVNLAILQHQQKLAVLSNQLGETAVNTMTPAAYMKEVPITALNAAAKSNDAVAPAALTGSAPAATDAKASVLDMPPATVGPLSLRLAAAKGDASAEFEAGSRLAEGKGTAQNFKEALRWYQRSAAQGFAQAQYRLGTLYERGLGIKADTGMARSWYQRSAEQGNVKAMHNLAVLSASRQNNAPDYSTAATWFTQAAERDLQDSQFNLGVLYESGLGVDKDMTQAMKWYSLAARAGDAESVRRRDALKAQLSPQELQQVDATVAAFRPIKIEDPLINDARAAGEDWKKRMSDEAQG